MHSRDRLGHDPKYRSAPTGMNCPDSTLRWIRNEDREAIGRADRERDPGLVRDHSVTFADTAGSVRHKNLI
jgi:hypothetical protein